MIPITAFRSQRLALFGLGISGLSAATALVAGGAEVIVFDDNEGRRGDALKRGFVVEDLSNADWDAFAALVLSPGVPLTHPEPHWVVKQAQANDVPVIGDTELFFREFLKRGARLNDDPTFSANDRVIVITGTNGKSTTTALTAHCVDVAGERGVMGGNIGLGVLDMPDFGGGTVYVLELSSYQIDLTPSLRPTAAGLLNITPDHIDRHGTVENYAAIKGRIFDQLDGGGLGVISLDDGYCRGLAEGLAKHEARGGALQFVSAGQPVDDGAQIHASGFEVSVGGRVEQSVDLSQFASLRGVHNAQNAAFAFLLGNHVTENSNGLIEGLANFPGLAHRMQQIGVLARDGRRLLFVNDSKATNAEASQQALNSFNEIYWIAGGRAKAGGIAALSPHFGRVRKAFLIGEAAADFAETLRAENVPFEICGELEQAVQAAVATGLSDQALDGRDDNAEAAILLSPAAASFDQYPNFEVRGGAFREIVARVDGIDLNDGG